jgi:hypothetical protein
VARTIADLEGNDDIKPRTLPKRLGIGRWIGVRGRDRRQLPDFRGSASLRGHTLGDEVDYTKAMEAPMTTLTAELRREIEKAGDTLVRIEDPETRAAYVLMKAEIYERIKPSLGGELATTEQVPEGIRRSKEAFLRDLPNLLARKRWHGRWVLYHGDEQVRIAKRPDKLLRECSKRGIRDDEFYLGVIDPHPSEPDEIERSFFEFDEVEPVA